MVCCKECADRQLWGCAEEEMSYQACFMPNRRGKACLSPAVVFPGYRTEYRTKRPLDLHGPAYRSKYTSLRSNPGLRLLRPATGPPPLLLGRRCRIQLLLGPVQWRIPTDRIGSLQIRLFA